MIKTTRPRVLMFCGKFWPKIGGAERQAQKLALALIRNGCHVEILTPQLEKTWPLEEVRDGLRINRFPFLNLTHNLKGVRGLGVPNALLLGFQVRRAVSRQILGFDVLHTHIASPMVAYAMEAAQAHGKKAICKIAAGGNPFDFISLRRTSLLGPGLEKKLIRAMDRWVAISSEIRLDLEGAGVSSDRIVNIPNGVDIPPPSNRRVGKKACSFLYLGRFSHTAHKDYATLLLAFDKLVMEFPECQLKLVGGGEREREIQNLLEGLPHASSRTELIGFCDPKPWLEWADALIQPSLAEGMSNTLLEGMAHGVTCIANDIPPNRELLGDGEAGILVPVGDVGALIQAMRKLATIPGECEHWRQRGRKRVEEVYSIDRITDEYLQLYAGLLKA
ncbi:MAG: glycosyltransferase family 4 protein [Nitrospirales bacterium]